MMTTSDATEKKPRRWFLLSLGGVAAAWLGAALYPVLRYLSPQQAPDPFGEDGRALVEKIAAADVLRPGMGKNGAYGGRGLLVFRDQSGALRAAGFAAKPIKYPGGPMIDAPYPTGTCRFTLRNATHRVAVAPP